MSVAGGGGGLAARVGLVLGQVPPALVGAQAWSAVVAHPVVAGVLFVAYEALMVGLGFAGEVYQAVKSKRVQQVANKVDGIIDTPKGRTFERQYRKFVLSQHQHVDLRDQEIRGASAPDLAEVYVDVSVVPRTAHAASRDPLASAPDGYTTARQSVWDFLDTPEGAALAVVGAPGTGKTTLLKHLATELAQPADRRKRHRNLPVLLLLRDCAPIVAAQPDTTLPEMIRASLHADMWKNEPGEWFEQRLTAGRCTVLLDGLDEVADDSERRKVAKWAERQIEAYQGNDFVLTSRPHGYLSAPLNQPQVLQVRQFTSDQIAGFVRGWYRALRADGLTEANRAKGAEDLLARLQTKPMLYELATNPLLLTMIANVHLYLRRLPDSRAELYREIFDVLLWRRHQAKHDAGTDAQRLGRQREAVLAELAFGMMEGNVRDIRVKKAAELLRTPLWSLEPSLTCEDFLASITATGILIERERGEYSFAHLTFQEYLAAVHILRGGLVAKLTQVVDQEWWRETCLLYAADPDSDPSSIVKACLDADTLKALPLAFDIADVADARLAAEVAERLERVRTDGLNEPLPSPKRKLMMAVTLSRQFQETVRAENGTVLCTRPVSAEVYRLFLDERGTTVSPAWTRREGGAAVDITPQDVRLFVAWVNRWLGPDGPRWRPVSSEDTREAAFDLAVGGSSHTVWCTDRDQKLTLWVPDGAPHPWTPQVTTPSESAPGYRDLLAFLVLRQLREDLPKLTDAYAHRLIQILKACQGPEKDRDRPGIAQALRAARNYSTGSALRNGTTALAMSLSNALAEAERRLGTARDRNVYPWDSLWPRLHFQQLLRDADVHPAFSRKPALMRAKNAMLPALADASAKPELAKVCTLLERNIHTTVSQYPPNVTQGSAELNSVALASLALSAAAEAFDLPDAAADFRTVAIGTAVLLQRQDGTIAPSETIILARA